MPHSVLIHISGEEAVVGEIDSLPDPTDQVLIVSAFVTVMDVTSLMFCLRLTL